MKIYIISFLIVLALIYLIFAFKSHKPVKFLLFNAFLGTSFLLILYLTRKLTGLNVAINQYTAIFSSIFGVPTVLVLLFLNFIILM